MLARAAGPAKRLHCCPIGGAAATRREAVDALGPDAAVSSVGLKEAAHGQAERHFVPASRAIELGWLWRA
jgi:hypothetical protein